MEAHSTQAQQLENLNDLQNVYSNDPPQQLVYPEDPWSKTQDPWSDDSKSQPQSLLDLNVPRTPQTMQGHPVQGVQPLLGGQAVQGGQMVQRGQAASAVRPLLGGQSVQGGQPMHGIQPLLGGQLGQQVMQGSGMQMSTPSGAAVVSQQPVMIPASSAQYDPMYAAQPGFVCEIS